MNQIKRSSSSLLEHDYRAIINRVMDYIQTNLGKKLTLEELSAIACFVSMEKLERFR